MRIECTGLEAFLLNLDGQDVYTKAVHVDRSLRPLNGRTPAEATSHEVIFQASAIVDYEDGGQCLVQCGEICGVDRATDGGVTEGTGAWTRLYNHLSQFCKDRGWRLLPGVIGI